MSEKKGGIVDTHAYLQDTFESTYADSIDIEPSFCMQYT